MERKRSTTVASKKLRKTETQGVLSPRGVKEKKGREKSSDSIADRRGSKNFIGKLEKKESGEKGGESRRKEKKEKGERKEKEKEKGGERKERKRESRIVEEKVEEKKGEERKKEKKEERKKSEKKKTRRKMEGQVSSGKEVEMSVTNSEKNDEVTPDAEEKQDADDEFVMHLRPNHQKFNFRPIGSLSGVPGGKNLFSSLLFKILSDLFAYISYFGWPADNPRGKLTIFLSFTHVLSFKLSNSRFPLTLSPDQEMKISDTEFVALFAPTLVSAPPSLPTPSPPLPSSSHVPTLPYPSPRVNASLGAIGFERDVTGKEGIGEMKGDSKIEEKRKEKWDEKMGEMKGMFKEEGGEGRGGESMVKEGSRPEMESKANQPSYIPATSENTGEASHQHDSVLKFLDSHPEKEVFAHTENAQNPSYFPYMDHPHGGFPMMDPSRGEFPNMDANQFGPPPFMIDPMLGQFVPVPIDPNTGEPQFIMNLPPDFVPLQMNPPAGSFYPVPIEHPPGSGQYIYQTELLPADFNQNFPPPGFPMYLQDGTQAPFMMPPPGFPMYLPDGTQAPIANADISNQFQGLPPPGFPMFAGGIPSENQANGATSYMATPDSLGLDPSLYPQGTFFQMDSEGNIQFAPPMDSQMYLAPPPEFGMDPALSQQRDALQMGPPLGYQMDPTLHQMNPNQMCLPSTYPLDPNRPAFPMEPNQMDQLQMGNPNFPMGHPISQEHAPVQFQNEYPSLSPSLPPPTVSEEEREKREGLFRAQQEQLLMERYEWQVQGGDSHTTSGNQATFADRIMYKRREYLNAKWERCFLRDAEKAEARRRDSQRFAFKNWINFHIGNTVGLGKVEDLDLDLSGGNLIFFLK